LNPDCFLPIGHLSGAPLLNRQLLGRCQLHARQIGDRDVTADSVSRCRLVYPGLLLFADCAQLAWATGVEDAAGWRADCTWNFAGKADALRVAVRDRRDRR